MILNNSKCPEDQLHLLITRLLHSSLPSPVLIGGVGLHDPTHKFSFIYCAGDQKSAMFSLVTISARVTSLPHSGTSPLTR